MTRDQFLTLLTIVEDFNERAPNPDARVDDIEQELIDIVYGIPEEETR